MPDLPEAVIFDMDGTLCDVRTVRHLIDGPGGFRAFHRASASCPPHAWVVEAARQEHEAGRAVLIVTGRAAEHRNVTAMWLALHDVPSEGLWMRHWQDFRPDYEVKRDILTRIRQVYRPVAAWDDNPNVIRLWREEGLGVTVVPGWEKMTP